VSEITIRRIGLALTSKANAVWARLRSPIRFTLRSSHPRDGSGPFMSTAGRATFPPLAQVLRRFYAPEDSGVSTLDAIYSNGITLDDVEVEFANFNLNELPIVVLYEPVLIA
jgi:hypothetical protein